MGRRQDGVTDVSAVYRGVHGIRLIAVNKAYVAICDIHADYMVKVASSLLNTEIRTRQLSSTAVFKFRGSSIIGRKIMLNLKPSLWF